MDHQKFSGKTILAAAIFVSAVFLLGIKLLNPTPIQIFVEGRETAASQLPGFFTSADAALLIISSIALGISGMYLLFFDFRAGMSGNSAGNSTGFGESTLAERKKKWDESIKTLKDDEQKICKAIVESDGIINQSDLPEKTGLPKANISRSLDLLESRGLVDKRRRGMGNVVLLK